ncbi:MAG: hypothetical protein LAO09_17875 [Acidobacteriia bacterium]|nr:hypothetical protein [Terriglobia bacterium]
MSAPPRIGGIPYLNVRPLVYGIESQVGYSEPSRLADLMYRKQFDVGIMPIAEVLPEAPHPITHEPLREAAERARRNTWIVERPGLLKSLP